MGPINPLCSLAPVLAEICFPFPTEKKQAEKTTWDRDAIAFDRSRGKLCEMTSCDFIGDFHGKCFDRIHIHYHS